jgi:hypothetical protein
MALRFHSRFGVGPRRRFFSRFRVHLASSGPSEPKPPCKAKLCQPKACQATRAASLLIQPAKASSKSRNPAPRVPSRKGQPEKPKPSTSSSTPQRPALRAETQQAGRARKPPALNPRAPSLQTHPPSSAAEPPRAAPPKPPCKAQLCQPKACQATWATSLLIQPAKASSKSRNPAPPDPTRKGQL